MDQNAERQQEELEKGLQGAPSFPPVSRTVSVIHTPLTVGELPFAYTCYQVEL